MRIGPNVSPTSANATDPLTLGLVTLRMKRTPSGPPIDRTGNDRFGLRIQSMNATPQRPTPGRKAKERAGKRR